MTAAEYAAGVRGADRTILGRAFTLVESRKPADRAVAEELLQLLSRDSNHNAVRLGVTGAPGVGKSTFIEALGKRLIAQGHRVAVLAVDPSSEISGGSILGDKTRMPELSRSAQALVRPSPSGGALGGVHNRTREAILLCEAAGFDIVIVETVGVGQSETQVASMTDCFLVLIGPGAGDHLQGIKRGVIELADALVVTKADGDSASLAENTRQEFAHALELLHADRDGWQPRVLTCSSLEDQGIAETWATVAEHREFLLSNNRLAERRRQQRLRWFHEVVDALLRERFLTDPTTAARLESLAAQVLRGELTPSAAAQAALSATSQA
ncbi:MAG: methylmalonyl Co-A mutase-associated GTPase MeaB [Acidobacteria bacterium]|nr:methylmalonyl Co-A mutase-associated GTPase MeaB [Acidobacteriota bacterium]MDA1236065.1 methylmalonyl Co-A mutase-associated GTPase MeaB [Acidobacteriota bacterium]